MKNRLLILIMAMVILPLTGVAQNSVFEKYSENPDVTYVNIKPKMFQMIAKIGIETDDAEAKAYMDMVKSITSFKTIVTDNQSISADISKWVKSRSSALEELMEVKDDGSEVKFYVKEGKDSDHVEELLIFEKPKLARRLLKKIEKSEIYKNNETLFSFLNYTTYKILDDEEKVTLLKSKISSLDLKKAELILNINRIHIGNSN